MSEAPKMIHIFIEDDGYYQGYGCQLKDTRGKVVTTPYRRADIPWLPDDAVSTLTAVALVMESDARWEDLQGLLNKQIVGAQIRDILNALKEGEK